MLYKKIIQKRETRLRILRILDFIPDKIMINVQYYLSKSKKINLKTPLRFTEKLQWYKLYYRKKLMTICSDKYEVREYIKSKRLENLLVTLYRYYEDADEIDFDHLPNKFVLKTTNGSHTNIICESKDQLDKKDAIYNLNNWLKNWQGKVGREWSYYNIKPRIICEELLEKDANNDLIDYKFFCFNGKVFCLYVIIERFLKDGIKLGIYDKKFQKLPYRRSDIPDITHNIEKPDNFEKMIEIAEVLSKDFPHVRVDLYNINGRIYFGELTFYDGSGYKGYIPDEFDFILGNEFKLPDKTIEVL